MEESKRNKDMIDDANREIDDESDEEEGDFIDDEEKDGRVMLTDDQLKDMGIDMDLYNAPLQPGEEQDDGKSWMTDDPMGADDNIIEEDEGEDIDESMTSMQSYSDRIKRAYRGHTDAVLCIEVMNGCIFSGGMDDSIIKWSIESENPIEIKKFKETVSFMSSRPESDLLVAGFLDDTILVFKGSSFELVQTIKTEYEEITSLRFHDKSDSILASFKNGSIHIWNALTGKLMVSLYGHFDEVTDSQFTVDSRLMLIPS